MFQTFIPKPYDNNLKQLLRAAVKNTATNEQKQAQRAAHPEDYLHGPVPNAATVDSYCVRPGMLTQQQCDNFACLRDFLLDIAGETVVFDKSTALPPETVERYQLYLGERTGGTVLNLTTRPMLRNGYLETIMTDNPFLKLFKGLLLNQYGYWDYQESPVIVENGRVLFIENHSQTVAYFGEICDWSKSN